jgi:DNA-binding PadR family transcriptional regulator
LTLFLVGGMILLGVITMMLSELQKTMLRKTSNGILWEDLTEDQQDALRYLDELGLTTARVDLGDDLWLLTEKGKAALAELTALEEQTEQESQKQTNEKEEQTTEKRRERRFRILEIFLSAFLGAVFANLDRIIAFLVKWLPKIWGAIWEWFVSLF